MTMVQNLRYALRSLASSRGYAFAFIVTLGLGIGVNTAIFSVINGVLLSPLPYQDADRILYVEQSATLAAVANTSFSFIEIDDYRASSRTIDEFVEYGDWSFSVIGRGDPHLVVGGLVTSNYFEVLGLKALHGRTLQPSDDEAAAPPVMLLTHDYWTRMFGADPDIVGQTIKLTSKTVEIIGVLEPGTHYTGSRKQDVFANYTTNDHYRGAAMRDARGHRMTSLFARLAPGSSIEAAQGELAQINARMREASPEDYPERLGYDIRAARWQDVLTEDARPTLLILMGTVVMVLLLACANVANLTLTRLIRRERELSIRAALGAGKGQIRRQLLTENLVLSLSGAALGLLLAFAGLDLLVSYANRLTIRTEDIGISGLVLAFTLVIGVGIAMLLAWAPSLPFTSEIGMSLSAAGGRNSGALSRRRLQRLLVVGQLAMSFTLLIGAGLLVRSLINLQQVDPGFDSTDVVTLQSPNFTSMSPEDSRTMFEGVVEQVRHYPGVKSVAYAGWAPLQSFPPQTRVFEVEGQTEPVASTPMGLFNTVSDDYFKTVGSTLMQGRSFSREDTQDTEAVTILNESMARAYFPDESPIGKRVRSQSFGGQFSPWQRVIGVVSNTRDVGIAQTDVHVMYFSAAQSFPGNTVLVRTTGEVGPLANRIKEIIREADAERPVTQITTLAELRREDIAPQRLNATLFSSFAVLALVVAAVGVLGVLAFSVTQRTREFGVRMALGAEQSEVLRMVLKEGALLALGALIVGGAASLALSRFLSGLLFQIEPTDPLTYAGDRVVPASSPGHEGRPHRSVEKRVDLTASAAPACSRLRMPPRRPIAWRPLRSV